MVQLFLYIRNIRRHLSLGIINVCFCLGLANMIMITAYIIIMITYHRQHKYDHRHHHTRDHHQTTIKKTHYCKGLTAGAADPN